MPKERPRAELRVADGEGGMRVVEDHRFDDGPWPLDFSVAAKDAEAWMAHLRAETTKRGWNTGGISQREAAENSGTLSIRSASGPSSPTLDLVWDKPRTGDLLIRGRPGGNPAMSLDTAEEFIRAVRDRVSSGAIDRAHRWDLLSYQGLPWRGELWLSNDLRLGPPSRFPEALLGSQVLVVDATLDGIGQAGITTNFQRLVLELRVFLGAVLGVCTSPVRPEDGWVTDFDERGRPIECALRSVGYWHVGGPRGFPERGSVAPVAREAVTRPGLGRVGIWADTREQWVPTDIEELWEAFRALPQAKRDAFLRAGNAYLIADSMWPAQRTAYVVFHVITCEALKPKGRRYNEMNIYDVVASLLGNPEALRLKELSVHPQKVRSGHVHRGTLAAGELVPTFLSDDFADPSFDDMLRELASLTRTCLIEWLRCGGSYKPVHRYGAKRVSGKKKVPLVRSIIARARRWVMRK